MGPGDFINPDLDVLHAFTDTDHSEARGETIKCVKQTEATTELKDSLEFQMVMRGLTNAPS